MAVHSCGCNGRLCPGWRHGATRIDGKASDVKHGKDAAFGTGRRWRYKRNRLRKRDESGQQVWFGEADPGVAALGNALQAIIDEHNDQTTGVALCSHYEGAMIFVVSPSNDVHQSIAEIASKFPDLQVITRTTTAAISQLSAVGRKLLQSPEMQGILTGVVPDMSSGGLRITVAKDKWPLSANEKGRIDHAVKVINGSRLPLTYEQGGTAVLD